VNFKYKGELIVKIDCIVYLSNKNEVSLDLLVVFRISIEILTETCAPESWHALKNFKKIRSFFHCEVLKKKSEVK